MPWNPDTYNQFKEERYQPFYDMISHLHVKSNLQILDLGCGTGELTQTLANKFTGSKTVGVDNSVEMLCNAPMQKNLFFTNISIEEQLEKKEKWDVVVANASLQWIEDHQTLFPKIISILNEGGQLAVQMPSQKENLLNQILYKLVHEQPYYDSLKDVIRHSPVLSLDEYTSLLYSNHAKEVLVYQKVYPIIAESFESLYKFIAGSALIPYMEQLEGAMKESFEKEFKSRIADVFTSTPMVYAFKRIVLVAAF